MEQSKTQAEEWFRKGKELLVKAEGMAFSSVDRYEVEREASQWFRKAAEHGHAIAQFELYLSYDLGRGVEYDPKVSLFWIKNSAVHGLKAAQTDLAFDYWKEKSYEEARYWYQKAAKQNDLQSHIRLGEMYHKGYGCEKNCDLALHLYQQGCGLIDQGFSCSKEVIDDGDYWFDFFVHDCFDLLDLLYLLHTESGLGKHEYEALLQRLGDMVLDDAYEARSRWDSHFKDVVMMLLGGRRY